MSGKPQPGDFQVEYSKSGRAKCFLTKEPIPEGDLRIGMFVQAKNFDGAYPMCTCTSTAKILTSITR